MNRKIYWGLAVLIVLLIGVTVFVVIKDQAEMRQLEKEFAEAEKQGAESEAPSQPIADNRPPPPGKSFEGGGHWHDGEWHDAPHSPAEQGFVPVEKMTPAQKAEWEKFWKEQGLDPPPKGHGYRYNKDGSVAGLFKYNEPEFEAGWSEKLAPGQDFTKLTEMEWIRYHALSHIVSGRLLYIEGDMIKRFTAGEPMPNATYAPGVQALAREWKKELRNKASGPTVQVTTIVTWSRDPTQKELEAIDRKSDELTEELLPQRPKRERPEWQSYVEPLVKELEAAIAAKQK